MLRKITNIKPFMGTDIIKPHQEISNLKKGQIIKGVVLKKFPGGEILVSSGGSKFRAFTGLKLAEGSEYHFQVNKAGSKIELKLLDILSAKLGLHIRSLSSNSVPRSEFTGILAYLSDPHNFSSLSGKMTRAFKDLRQYLNSLILGNSVDKNNLWASRSILGSGLFWENRILQYILNKQRGSWKRIMSSDLKGLLLSLDRDIQAGIKDHDDVKSLSLRIKQALNIIEQDQFLNLSSSH